MRKIGWCRLRCLLTSEIPLALSLTISVVALNMPCHASHSHQPKNFFLDTHANAPCFAGPQLSESELENRRIPDIRLLRTLPGLDPETRKRIDRLYKDWQSDTSDLRNHMQAIQRQIGKLTEAAATSQSVPANDVSSNFSTGAPQSAQENSTANKPRESSGQEKPDTLMSDSQNLPDISSKVEKAQQIEKLEKNTKLEKSEDAVTGKSLVALKQEQKDSRQEMLSKRKELWEKIRPLLTEQNQQDLEKMRRGEFKPKTTASESGK